jgi:hypothetical protein
MQAATAAAAAIESDGKSITPAAADELRRCFCEVCYVPPASFGEERSGRHLTRRRPFDQMARLPL